MPPSYASRDYWDDRFSSEQKFDWLVPTETAKSIVSDQLDQTPTGPESKVLHIGCGNSGLSSGLIDLIQLPGSITHMDFSDKVIQAGREASTSRSFERWVAADLLRTADVQKTAIEAGGPGTFDLIVDKSTCDSIACGEDVAIQLPDPMPGQNGSLLSKETAKKSADPLHVLAINLAAVTSQGNGRWTAFSYSAYRFQDFESENSYHMPAPVGFPDPRSLWTVEEKWSIEVPASPLKSSADHIVHRPPELCWVYVLVRTAVTLPPVLSD